jgi:hypothetical protein
MLRIPLAESIPEEFDMVPIRRRVAIARAWAALDEDGALREPPVAEARGMLDDLVWWARRLARRPHAGDGGVRSATR